MKRRERGILTIEASLVLTLMLLVILFLFGFGRVYRAQNLVGHATLQSADAIALESYLRETALESDVEDVVYLSSHITESTAISAESLESLRSADLPKIARQKFIAAIAGTEEKADEKLKAMGIKNGLAGVDFSQCKMDLTNDDVIVAIRYTVKMQFPILGFQEIEVTKAAKAKTFGEILFAVSTEPNVPGWGSTGGDNKVTHGSTVTITATPNYGYKFVSWNDGVTDNPRVVLVTEAMHYVAIFEKAKFGINLSTKIQYNTAYSGIHHENYATLNGGGNYDYLDEISISAVPSANYEFEGWDDNGDGLIDTRDNPRSITVDKTYHINALFRPAMIAVSVRVNDSTYGYAEISQGEQRGTSIRVEYGSRVNLMAQTRDTGKYLFKKWDHGHTQNYITETVLESKTYTAIFELNTYTVNFYNGSTRVHSTKVIRGSSIEGSRGIVGASMPGNPYKSGASFDKWKYNGSNTFTAATVVNGDLNVYAGWKYTVTLNANGGSINGASSKSFTVSEGGSFNFSAYTPSRGGYHFGGWHSGGRKYEGNKTINSAITVTASWSCAHSSRYEERHGTVCSGGTIIYKCSWCQTTLGSANYGGTGHDWSARCNLRHYLNYFNGRVSGGCGQYHSSGARSFCQVCVHCSALRSGYNWCAHNHMIGRAGSRPKRYPPQHNYWRLGGDEY